MSEKHHDPRYVKLRAQLKPRLLAQLPATCARCGQVMSVSMKLDFGHISRDPALAYEPSNFRLEHAHCGRKHGQSITTAKRAWRGAGARLGRW